MGMRQLGLETLELGAGIAPSYRSGKYPGFQYSEQSAGAAHSKSNPLVYSHQWD